jgi:HK97 family phage major capsid protein
MKLKKLRAELARVVGEAKTLRDAAKDRELTAEESAKVADLVAKAEGCKIAIAQAEKEAAALADLSRTIESVEAPAEPRAGIEIGEDADAERQGAARQVAQRTAVSVRPRYAGRLINFREDEAGLRSAYFAGMSLRAQLLKPGSPRQAEALRYCRDHRGDMWPDAVNMSGTVAADGGVLVPDAMENSVRMVAENYGAVRGVLTRDGLLINMPSDTLTVPIEDGLPTVYSTAQGSAITASKPTFTYATLSAKKLGVLVAIPRELVEDSVINIADYVAGRAGVAIAKAEDTDAWLGDGTATYHSIVGLLSLLVDGNHAGSLVTASGSQADTFAEILQADLDNVCGELPERFSMRARWFSSKKAAYRIMIRLARAAGGATADDLAGRKFRSYDGDEIVFVQPMPNNPLYYTGSTDYSGLPMVGYGDLGSALIMGQRRGLEVALSQDIYFAEDMLAVRVTERIDMQPGAVGAGTGVPGAMILLIGS